MSDKIVKLLDGVSIEGDLTAQLKALKEAVDGELVDYRDPRPIDTAERYREMKRWRANIRAVKAPIDKARKASKKRYTDLIKQFDRTIGEITAPIDELDGEYKALIDDWERRRDEAFKSRLAEHYAELAPNLVPLVPFDRILDPYWLRASFGEKKAMRAVEDAVARLARQYGAVMAMDFDDEGEREWAVSWWAERLPEDSGEVAHAVMGRRERLARVSELNAGYRASRAPAPGPEQAPAPEPPETAPEPVAQAPTAPEAETGAKAPQGAAYRVVIDCPDVETLRAVKAVMVASGFHGRVERIQ